MIAILLLTAAPAPIVSSGDQMVDQRLATLGRLTKNDGDAFLTRAPSVSNLVPPADAKGRRLTCPSVSGSYSFSAGGHSTSGRYSVSGRCIWIP